MHVVDEHQQAGDLHGLVDAEFLGGLHGVGEVTTGIGQAQDLCLARLGLQQERREVRRIQRVAHRTNHGTAIGLDHGGGVAFQRVAKGVVGRQEVPVLVAGLDQRVAGHLGQGHGVVGVVHGVGRAVFIGQAGRACAHDDEGALLFRGNFGHGQGRARAGATDQHGQAVLVDPFAGLGAGHVGLVLVVCRQHFNRAAQHLAAEVLRGPLDHFTAGRAVDVGVQAGHVGDKADLDRAGVGLRESAGGAKADGQGSDEGFEFHWGVSGVEQRGIRVRGKALTRPDTPAACPCCRAVRPAQTA